MAYGFNNDKSKVEIYSKTEVDSEIDNVNDRIDNIITSPAPTEQEIIDARLGADGVTYPSLGDAIRDQVSDLKSDVNNIEIENYQSEVWETVNLTPYFVGNAFIAVSENSYTITSNSSYRYYSIPTDGITKVRASGFSGERIKALVFANDNDELIDYYPKEVIPSPGSAVNIECSVPHGATKMLLSTNVYYTQASLSIYHIRYSLDADTKDLLKSIPLLNGISIEGYEKTIQTADGTVKNDYALIGANATEYSLSGWQYLTVDCSQYNKIYVSGYSGTSVSLYFLFDEDDNIISYYPFPSSNTGYTLVEVDVPANAAKICVNGNSNHVAASVSYYGFNFVSGDSPAVGVEISANNWEIGRGKFKTTAELNGSRNGAFNINFIYYDSGWFKTVNDDVTPINEIDAGYIGANHGYNYIYVATLANHGLTNADIGKTCIVDGETWMLVKVNDSSKFTVICRSNTVWFGAKRMNVLPTSFNFGTILTPTSISSVEQLYPSIKNIDVAVVENSADRFVVAESYDIINLKTGLDGIASNVGNNTNNSIVDLADTAFTIRNLYTFFPNGSCNLIQNLKMNNSSARLNFYGGTQSIAFGTDDYFAVPMTDKADFTASGEAVDFMRSSWDEPDKPPMIYIQIDNAPNTATKMMVQGFVMEGRNSLLNNYAGFIHTTRKMYPYAIQPQAASEVGHTYDTVCFRLPIKAYDADTSVKFVGYCKVKSDYYFFAYNPTAVSKTISVPSELCGKNVEAVISKDAVCLNKVVATGIDFSTANGGYVLLKLTD